jgi:protein-tyrosine phosphatase
MDMTWITDRIAVGGGIETRENMETVAKAGITHIIDMQIEFDDTQLAEPYKIKVLWNGIYNDFQSKPPELFARGVEFGLAALRKHKSKVLIHCTLGMHRAPMMALALLCAMGWPIEVAIDSIQKCRPVVYFADSYVKSVEAYLAHRHTGPAEEPQATPVADQLAEFAGSELPEAV